MTDYLVLDLYGAMTAWGAVAIGEQRPNTAHPSKSAILGLFAAALGIRRDQEEQLLALNTGYAIAIHEVAHGIPLSDYHTTHMPKIAKKDRHFYTRKNETDSTGKTGLSRRDYTCDARHTVMIWANSAAPYTLPQLQAALNKPLFTLYLGRKSCPLALPLNPQCITAKDFLQAWQRYQQQQQHKTATWQHPSPQSAHRFYWEGKQTPAGIRKYHSSQRIDQLHSRQRWQYQARTEHMGELLNEDSACT